ncbi:hypothetical protein ACFX2A_022673 [Malus domestica]
MAPPKILLSGDVSSNLKQLFKRVVSVNKSTMGPFDPLLCVGQFFLNSADQLDEFNDYIEGRAQIPLQTPFIGDYGVGAAKVLLAATRDAGNQGFKWDGARRVDNGGDSGLLGSFESVQGTSLCSQCITLSLPSLFTTLTTSGDL